MENNFPVIGLANIDQQLSTYMCSFTRIAKREYFARCVTQNCTLEITSPPQGKKYSITSQLPAYFQIEYHNMDNTIRSVYFKHRKGNYYVKT